MEQLHYLSLKDFLEKTSTGEICPSAPVEIRNMTGDQIHHISYLDHCNALCQKHDTNLLKLLSVINQKVNNDMIIRLGRSPIFKTKVVQVMNDRGYDTTQLSPEDIFECPEECYDISDLQRELGLKKELDDKFVSLEDSMDNSQEENTDNVYHNLSSLKDNYHACEQSLVQELQSVRDNCNAYEPKYGPVLYTLARITPSEYLKDSLEGEGEKMKKFVRRNTEKYLGNGNVCMGVLLLSDMMKEELEKCERNGQRAIDDIRNKKDEANIILGRIPEPGLTFVERIMKGFLESSDDEEDEDKELEEQMAQMIKSDDEDTEEQENNEEKKDSEPSPAHAWEGLGEASDEESGKKEKTDKGGYELPLDQIGGDLSFF